MLGTFLITLGLLLRWWALKTLINEGLSIGKILSAEPPISRTYNGPYNFISHPAYVGTLVIYAGIGHLLLGMAGLIGFPLLIWPLIMDRIIREKV